MKPFLTLLLTLSLAVFACAAPAWVPTPTAIPLLTPAPNATATALPTPIETPNALGIVGTVYIREIPNGKRIGSLELGAVVNGVCSGDWCRIDAGYVWRGCTDNNPNALGCQAK